MSLIGTPENLRIAALMEYIIYDEDTGDIIGIEENISAQDRKELEAILEAMRTEMESSTPIIKY